MEILADGSHCLIRIRVNMGLAEGSRAAGWKVPAVAVVVLDADDDGEVEPMPVLDT